MRRRDTSWLIPVLLAVGAAAALVYYWWQSRPTDVQPVDAPTPVAQEPEEEAPGGPLYPLEPLAGPDTSNRKLVPLPALDDSDAYFRLELVNIFGAPLEQLLANEALIERFVATIDNLPRSHVAERLRPVGGLSGSLSVDSLGDELILSPVNYDRYTVLVDLFARADTKELTDAYRRYYPLFQEAYVGLGYPDGYFNDRVVEVIDHLLDTPEPAEPIALIRPHVLYEFKDPDLQSLSSGQKLLLRMGPDNAARVKTALRRLRDQIS